MLKIGINGLGRIGRAILRVNMEHQAFSVVAVNESNVDINNIAYTVNYDTTYGQLHDKVKTKGDQLYNSCFKAKVFHKSHIDEVDWKSQEVDIVIDASGVYDNVLRAKSNIIKNKLRKNIITHSPDPVDFTMVLGVNEEEFDVQSHHVISSSICDTTALAPVIKAIHQHFIIEYGAVTTSHPFLNYQNVLDGPAVSWSFPGKIYHLYELGRSVFGNVIPKSTAAVAATCKVVNGVTEDMIYSFSYRPSTAIVASADITLVVNQKTCKQDIIDIFEKIHKIQKWNIIYNNYEPLVSLDFKQSSFSAIVDHRWTDVIKEKMIKLILWYDNEWGYSSRVVDQIKYIEQLMKT